jgi:curved DNA-binding protein
MTDHEILGVAQDASPDQIKVAYRKLAMKHHPDRNGGSADSEAKFKEITQAYENLTGKSKKQSHQQQHEQDPFGFGGGFNPFEGFGFAFHGGFRQRNPDYNVTATITLESAFSGCEITIDLPVEQQTIKVEIPAGVEDGQRIVIEGRGSQQVKDIPAGNLYVFVRVIPSSIYQRIGANLVTTANVDLWAMLSGTALEVSGIDGEVIKVEVPVSSNPNKAIRIPGKGMPRLDDNQRGDLIVQLTVDWPSQLSDEQLEAIQKLKS